MNPAHTNQKRHAIFYSHMETPIGKLLVASSEKGLVRIMFSHEGKVDSVSLLKKEHPEETLVEDRGKNLLVIKQLEEYFNGSRTVFSLPLDIRGTEFQKSVWDALKKVPYGETRSYGEIARSIGKPKAARAVGNANRKNPIPIVIPCHRIIGSDGSMTGFGGGIPLKKKLLELERGILKRTIPAKAQ